MPDSIGKLLKKARRAYKTGERGAAAHYIDKILQQDYTHRSVWKLLYREYGSGQSMQEFQREFTQQYYPDKQKILLDSAARGSLLSRIFSFRKKPAVKSAGVSAGRDAEKQRTRRKTEQQQPPTAAKDAPAKPVSQVSQSPPVASKEQLSRSDQPQRVEQAPVEIPAKLHPPEQTPQPEPQLLMPRPDKAGNIRVIVVDDTPQTRETIIRSLSFQQEIEIIASAENGMQAIALAKQTMPDVVLMDINMPDMDGITATAGVLHEAPYAQVVILTVQDDPDYMRKAMMAGAHDFLTKPPPLDELLSAVQNAGKVAHQEKRKAAQSMLASSRHAPSLTSRGKIITVHSPKGGVGCSTITVNLAAALHNDETKAVIVDSNLFYGDIIDLFNMQSENTLFDLAMRAGNLDFQMIEDVLVTHESGIHLLAPPGPEQADYVNPEQFIDVMENLRDIYPYVLVNTTSQLTENTLAALETSDLIILLATQDIPTVARVRKFFSTLELLKINKRRVLVVLNQYQKQAEINPDIIGKSIRHDIDALVPRDLRVVVPSVNRGIPFMLKSDLKSQPVSRAMLDLAEKVRQRLIQVADPSLMEESSSSPAR